MATRTDGFTPIFDDVARSEGLVGAAVFGCVWRHCQMRDGDCHASIDTMASLLHLDESTVRRQLTKLLGSKMIRRTQEPTPREPAHYVCLYAPEMDRLN